MSQSSKSPSDEDFEEERFVSREYELPSESHLSQEIDSHSSRRKLVPKTTEIGAMEAELVPDQGPISQIPSSLTSVPLFR